MNFIRTHKKLVIAASALAAAALVCLFAIYFYVGSYSRYVLKSTDVKSKKLRVAIVFGSGITKDGKPYKELQGRLDMGAALLKDGAVDKLLLSGDNRFEHYNEPDAMVKYLVDEKHIDKSKLQPDYAGRSTYETCERAKKVFSLEKALLISAPSHLPRAIFTCRAFGIESYGVPGGGDANNAFRRELLARPKAIFNQYLIGEKTILGDKIAL